MEREGVRGNRTDKERVKRRERWRESSEGIGRKGVRGNTYDRERERQRGREGWGEA